MSEDTILELVLFFYLIWVLGFEVSLLNLYGKHFYHRVILPDCTFQPHDLLSWFIMSISLLRIFDCLGVLPFLPLSLHDIFISLNIFKTVRFCLSLKTLRSVFFHGQSPWLHCGWSIFSFPCDSFIYFWENGGGLMF